MEKIIHKPVLLHEAIDLLNVEPGKSYLDCTLGSAGHSIEIINKGGKLHAIDQDPKAVKRASIRLSTCSKAEFQLKVGNFNQLLEAANHFKVKSFDGILFDLGLSSDQLDDPDRGFSFLSDAPLDMRADLTLTVTAADLVNGLHKGELSKLIDTYGQESYHQAIANRIVKERLESPIKTTHQLADLVSDVKRHHGKTHPATKTFQALRIAVNDELNNLKNALPQAVELLGKSGRLVIISFHSLEDKIVKNFIKGEPKLNNLTEKPITPSTEEVKDNPRSRSAKLRAAQII